MYIKLFGVQLQLSIIDLNVYMLIISKIIEETQNNIIIKPNNVLIGRKIKTLKD